MKRLPAVLLVLALAVVLGSLRDLLLINLNYQLDHVQRGTPYSYAHSAFQAAVSGWGLKALIALKWGLAIGFVAATWTLCQALLAVFGVRARAGRLVTIGFGGIAVLANLRTRTIDPGLVPLSRLQVAISAFGFLSVVAAYTALARHFLNEIH